MNAVALPRACTKTSNAQHAESMLVRFLRHWDFTKRESGARQNILASILRCVDAASSLAHHLAPHYLRPPKIAPRRWGARRGYGFVLRTPFSFFFSAATVCETRSTRRKFTTPAVTLW